jgi:hypothetical protein
LGVSIVDRTGLQAVRAIRALAITPAVTAWGTNLMGIPLH